MEEVGWSVWRLGVSNFGANTISTFSVISVNVYLCTNKEKLYILLNICETFVKTEHVITLQRKSLLIPYGEITQNRFSEPHAVKIKVNHKNILK